MIVIKLKQKSTVQSQEMHAWRLAESCFMQIYGIQASCLVIVCLLTKIQPVFSDQSTDKCSHSESCDSWEFDVRSEATRIKKLTATAVCSTVE